MLHKSIHQNGYTKKKTIKTYSCSPAFTSVNLDKAQARCVSASAGSMNVSLQEKKKREAVWNAARRLETVKTVAATIANHKNAHWAVDTEAEPVCSTAP